MELHKSKFFHILRSLSAWELVAFEKYLNSPFFNKNEKVLLFWEICKAYAPDYADENFSSSSCLARLFPQESAKIQQLRYVLTDITRLLEGYLAYTVWQEKEVPKSLHLSEAFANKGLKKFVDQTHKRIAASIEAINLQDTQQLDYRFQTVEQRFLYNPLDNEPAYSLPTLLESLDHFYLAKKLRYTCELINRTNVYNQSYELFLTQEILEALSAFPERGHRLVLLYKQVLLTLVEGESETHFHNLKNMLIESLDLIGQGELEHLFAFGLNYCIKQLNTGKAQFTREIFVLYQLMMEHRILFKDGRLPSGHFKNTVAVGTRLEEYEWTASFIESYKEFLPAEERQDAYVYNKAYLFFAKGSYRQVLKMLSTVEFPNVFYQLGAKSMLIRTYYELEDYDALSYLLGSFRMYLRRNKKVSAYQQKLYINLIKICQLMMRFQLGEAVSMEKIKQQITQHPDTASPNWVKEKISQL